MNVALPIFLLFKALLLAYYGVLWLAPTDYLYRRPAAVFYAKFTFFAQVRCISLCVPLCLLNSFFHSFFHAHGLCTAHTHFFSHLAPHRYTA